MRYLLPPLRRPLRLAGTFFGLGLLVTLAVTWLLAALVNVTEGKVTTADAYDETGHWSLTSYERAGATLISSTRIRGGSNWGPGQATGAPNTPTMGDQVTAWASRSSDGGTEWLDMQYAKAVIPRVVLVYENDAPGALYQVSIFDKDGKEHVAWTGFDPARPSAQAAPLAPATQPVPVSQKGVDLISGDVAISTVAVQPDRSATLTEGYTLTPTSGSASGAPAPPLTTTAGVPIARVPISLNIPTKRIKIYLACDKVPGWNEVDAVGLIDDQNVLQWATGATASSTYASAASGNASSTASPLLLIPAWCDVATPGARYQTEGAREDRLIDARGWPMLAMASERDGSQPTAAVNLTSSSVPSAYVPAQSGAPAPPSNTPIPLRPIWLGLLGNSAFYGTILAIGWVCLIVPRRFFREVGRFRSGCCINCGYDLGYDFLKGCPECGWRRDRSGETSGKAT